MLAKENKDFLSEVARREDKELFVRNLGELLSQTREHIVRCFIDNDDVVHVVYRNGHEQLANCKYDSYLAIVRDTCKDL